MKNKKIHFVILMILILLTVSFIWFNSALSGADSGELSGEVGQILEKLLLFLHVPSSVVDFLLIHIRKTAHFVEYAVIGAELALLWSGIKWNFQGLWNAFSTVLAISVLDETIQLFATSRGPQITDVLLDTAGGTSSILIVYFLIFIIMCIRKLAKIKQGDRPDIPAFPA